MPGLLCSKATACICRTHVFAAAAWPKRHVCACNLVTGGDVIELGTRRNRAWIVQSVTSTRAPPSEMVVPGNAAKLPYALQSRQFTAVRVAPILVLTRAGVMCRHGPTDDPSARVPRGVPSA